MKEITKGIVFGGCSFTWGQGLYYYSKLDTLKEPAPNQYDPNIVTDAHKRFAATLRYPRLVANHFNTFEVVSKKNGGNERETINFLDQLFCLKFNNYKNLTENEILTEDKMSYDEIEYIIIQLSQPHRNKYYYESFGKNYFFCVDSPETKIHFFDWFFNFKKDLSFSDWHKELTEILFNEVKQKMQFFENKGIKTKFLTWEEDYVPFSISDDWMKDRFIPLTYENKTYNSIRTLMDQNKGLTINNDFENFETPPQDHHPSLKCHQIIAENIINKIEEDVKI